MQEPPEGRPRSLVVRKGEALTSFIRLDENGEEVEVFYIVGEDPRSEEERRGSVANALALAGAWSDLDCDEFLDELDRLRHGELDRDFVVADDEPLLGVLESDNGHEVARYTTDSPRDHEGRQAQEARRQRLLRLKGAWGDLDADEVLDEVDRIRHAMPPSPPLQDEP
jgi:hypothetical protein